MTLWASDTEARQHWLDTTCERLPSDAGDYRFETGVAGTYEYDTARYLGHEEAPYWLELIDETGTVVELHWFGQAREVGDFIEAFRECQTITIEDRLGPFGLEWQREQMGARA